MNEAPSPKRPEALPELPEATPRRRTPLPFLASLLLHCALLAGIAAGVSGSQRTYLDGGITVSLVAGEGGGAAESDQPPGPAAPAPKTAPEEAAKEPVKQPPPPKKKAPAEIPVPARKVPKRPEPAPAPSPSPKEEAAGQEAQESQETPATPQAQAGSGESREEGALSAPAGSGSGPGRPGGAYSLGEVDQRPVLLRGTKPEYPTLARRNHIQGSVTVRMRIDEHGVPGEISILKAEPKGAFEESVLETLPEWRYRPALKSGKPVPVWVVLPLRFALN